MLNVNESSLLIDFCCSLSILNIVFVGLMKAARFFFFFFF